MRRNLSHLRKLQTSEKTNPICENYGLTAFEEQNENTYIEASSIRNFVFKVQGGNPAQNIVTKMTQSTY